VSVKVRAPPKRVRSEPTGEGQLLNHDTIKESKNEPENQSRVSKGEIDGMNDKALWSKLQVPGIYIKGSICDVDVDFTLDTGASRTIVSERIYKKMRVNQPALIETKMSPYQANGDSLGNVFRGNFCLKLGDCNMRRELLVADIQDDVLLGMDILSSAIDGEADILQSKSVIKVGSNEIPLYKVKPAIVRQVATNEFIELKGSSQTVVEVVLDGKTNCDLLIKGSSSFYEKNPVLVSSTLINGMKRCFVEIVNPLKSNCIIEKGTIIGVATEVKVVPDFIEMNEGEIMHHDDDVNVNKVYKVEIDEEVSDLAECLENMYGKAVEKYDTVQHEIDTGIQPPINQTHRKLPPAHIKREKAAAESLLKKGVIIRRATDVSLENKDSITRTETQEVQPHKEENSIFGVICLLITLLLSLMRTKMKSVIRKVTTWRRSINTNVHIIEGDNITVPGMESMLEEQEEKDDLNPIRDVLKMLDQEELQDECTEVCDYWNQGKCITCKVSKSPTRRTRAPRGMYTVGTWEPGGGVGGLQSSDHLNAFLRTMRYINIESQWLGLCI